MSVYYSVIQWVPDWGRVEAVSMGVLMYDTESAKHWFKINPSNERIVRLWGPQNLQSCTNQYESITHRLNNETFENFDVLLKFIAKHGNSLHFYQPRAMIMRQPPEIEIEDLYNSLVSYPDPSIEVNGVSFVLPSDSAIESVTALLTSLNINELSRILVELGKEKPRTNFIIQYLKEAADRRLA